MTNRFLAAITAAVLTSIVATPVLAQQPPAAAPAAPKAAPKPKAPAKQPAAQAPAAPAQRAQQPQQAPAQSAQQAPAPTGNQVGEQQVQLVYSPWTKICPKDDPPAGQAPANPPPQQFCVTGKDGRLESGQPVISAVIIAPQDQSAQKLLRVTLPLGMQLTQGTRIYVDKNQPIQRPFVLCFPQGCLADYEATPELINSMKKGQTLFVQAINSSGDLLTLTLPVADEFAKSFDGPAIDPKVLEDQQKKMQEELEKKAAAVKQQLEQSGNTPASGAPAAK